MKSILILLAVSTAFYAHGQVSFDTYFDEGALRIDYSHAGDSASEFFFFEQMKREPFWGGPEKNLLDNFDYGNYKLLVFDSAENELIYSHGFGTLFEEYITTQEGKWRAKSFYETQLIPFPKRKVRVEIHGRNRKNEFEKFWEITVDPKNYFIDAGNIEKYKVYEVHKSGKANNKVDIVFVPDGYTSNEMDKFKKDADKFATFFFEEEPFVDNKDKFNIYAVLAPSDESGTDVPGENKWVRTAVGTSFYTFDLDRYLMTQDVKALRNIAANVPYDQIYIIVNTKTYGGGAIYNYYNVVTSDNDVPKFVFCHEFGHGFGGLGDEYYTSATSYEDFYDLKTEPYQPNLTTLVDFDKKWKSLLSEETPIPTPASKEFMNSTGVFEGGGYIDKGVYRPAVTCTMKENTVKGYCEVCRKVITDMIRFFCDE